MTCLVESAEVVLALNYKKWLLKSISGVQFGLQSCEWLQNWTTLKQESDSSITSMITDPIGPVTNWL